MTNNIDAIHYLKINFDLAVCHKEFYLADELADKLSILSMNELISYSKEIDEYENMLRDQKRNLTKIFPDLQLESENTRELEEKIKKARGNYTKINQQWIDIQNARNLYSENEISKLRKIVINSIQHKDSYSVAIGSDRLSLLYLDKMKDYSKRFNLEESREEKEKIRKELTSVIEEWKQIIQLRDNFESEH